MPARIMTPVTFSCGHTVDFPRGLVPKRGEELLCIHCHKPVTVTKAPPYYRTECTMCSAVRRSGYTYDKLVESAQRHVNAKQFHVVVIYDGAIEIERIKAPRTDLVSRPIDKEHSNRLRELSKRYQIVTPESHRND